MKPKAVIAIGLILSLVAGPALAQTQQSTQGQQTPPPAQRPLPSPTRPPDPTLIVQSITPQHLDRIREAVGRDAALRIENGQLRIYVEVIGNWPTFADHVKGYSLLYGPTGYGNPMSHAEFVNMSTPRDLYSSSGITATEVATMAAVGVVGQWAIAKALNKIATSRKEKQLRDIRSQIDADLAAIKKDKDK